MKWVMAFGLSVAQTPPTLVNGKSAEAVERLGLQLKLFLGLHLPSKSRPLRSELFWSGTTFSILTDNSTKWSVPKNGACECGMVV